MPRRTGRRNHPRKKFLRSSLRALIKLVWRFHRWLYGVSRGRLGGRIVGMPVLLLTTTGRRSGRLHRIGLTYLDHESGVAVIGSNGGAPNHPDWVLNLRAHPHAIVQIGETITPVRAREATGGERSGLWDRAVKAYPGYDAYRVRTRRRIPVLVLEPARMERAISTGDGASKP